MEVYLDNNATTMVDPEVYKAMEPFFCHIYGNPNSLHKFGAGTHPKMVEALNYLYDGINAADADDIIITANGTESNNSVIKGIWIDKILNGNKNHIITSEVEHPSITAVCKFLETQGVSITYLPVNDEGVIDAKIVKKPLDIKWESSKLEIRYEKFLHILEGFKPKILDNVYGTKSSYSIMDAMYAFTLLNKQGVNTDSIRASLYYQVLVPFFILPMLVLIYKNSAVNSRFFNLGQFVNFGIFGTIVVWGIFFMLHKFSYGGVLSPEFALLIPILLLYLFTPYMIKKSFPNKVV